MPSHQCHVSCAWNVSTLWYVHQLSVWAELNLVDNQIVPITLSMCAQEGMAAMFKLRACLLLNDS